MMRYKVVVLSVMAVMMSTGIAYAGEMDAVSVQNGQNTELPLDIPGNKGADQKDKSVSEDLSAQVSVTDLAKRLGMDTTGFSTPLLDKASVSQDMTLDAESLAAYEKEGADQYLTGVFGSSYTGLDSNLFGVSVPDMNFEDLNTRFADMKASLSQKGAGITTDISIPQLADDKGSNAKEVFQNSWGDLSSQLSNTEFQIPSGFDADKMLSQGAQQREKTFGDLYSSSGYKTASGKMNVSEIFADAADGIKAYSLDSNSTLSGRLDKTSVSDLISGKKLSLKSDYLSGKGGARKNYSKLQDNASSTYEGLVDALKKDYENGASRHTKSGELSDDLGIGG